MRLIGKLPTPELAEHFSRYLTIQEVDNTRDDLEIWIHDDDQLKQATAAYRQFLVNPADPQFADVFEPPPPIIKKQKRYWGPITVITIIICALLFLWGSFEVATSKGKLNIITSPIYAALLYDYPPALAIQAKLLRTYTPEELENPDTLPPKGKELIRQFQKEKVWRGFYGEIVDRVQNGDEIHPPLFEDIRRGEVWRTFTPCLLHGGLLHIFFNVIWIIVLGNQVEQKIGWWRYLLLMVIVGILSNTAQYLMGGPLFLGLSGIVCGLLGFIWMRQRKAPWEGYLLSRTTVIFLSVFILGMAALQAASFFLEISGKSPIGVGIANTAHIAGILIGVVLGRWNLFSLQERANVRS